MNDKFSLYQTDGLWEIIENASDEKQTSIKSYFGSDLIIKRLNEQDQQIDRLKQQLAEKQKTIDEINKEFVQAVHDWKALCAEKDKEIEKLKTKQKPIVMHSKEDYFQRCNFLEEENIKLHFAQKQLAIQELEKVKNKCDGMYDLWLNSKYKENMYDNEDIAGVFDDISVFTNDLIKKLKGE